ncbi:unnamed protein product [Zymoseptoria tritici ST99CH_3D1]|nr:unnamed protein product [Zymoseptoria tritici ST99CH_3D1]
MIRDNGATFNSVMFNWVAHGFGSEELDDFGHCRVYVFSDSECTDAIHILDWANATHNLKQCYPLLPKDGKDVVGLRLECRRGDASW